MKLHLPFALIFILQFVFSERIAVFSGKKLVCNQFNKDYFHNITCGIKLINRNKQLYSMNFFFKPVIVESLKFRMKSYFKFRTEYRPLGAFMDDDACPYIKFLNGTKLITLANFKNLPMHYLNSVCPIKGPIDFNIVDLEIVPAHFTHFSEIVPMGDWYFETITYTIVSGQEIFLANVKNYFIMRHEYT